MGVVHLVVDVIAGGDAAVSAGSALLAGTVFALLFGASREQSGPALLRGTAFGFVLWVLDELTTRPLLSGRGLSWSAAAAQEAIEALPPTLLLGASLAVVHAWLGAMVRGLLVDDIRTVHREPPGGWGLRALGLGSVAGLVGTLVFTAVLFSAGALPDVAALMGTDALAAGVAVNLVIGLLIGLTYAVAFRRSSFDLVSGIGGGASYGFFWWVLGTLTLLPGLTGGVPSWDSTALDDAFPALVGHLAYGSALGGTYYLLETRANPWWVTRSEAERTRVAARRIQATGSAPALWGLTVMAALVIPVLISG